jgi:hypothetical protein
VFFNSVVISKHEHPFTWMTFIKICSRSTGMAQMGQKAECERGRCMISQELRFFSLALRPNAVATFAWSAQVWCQGLGVLESPSKEQIGALSAVEAPAGAQPVGRLCFLTGQGIMGTSRTTTTLCKDLSHLTMDLKETRLPCLSCDPGPS